MFSRTRKSSLLEAEGFQSDENLILQETDDIVVQPPSEFQLCCTEENVTGTRGDICVAVQGDRESSNPVMVTLHDVGQNHVTSFQSLFSFHLMKPLVDRFTVYHINFPGQQEDAPELPEDFVYPSMDEMVDLLVEVFSHYSLSGVVAIGVGAGANVLLRLAARHQNLIDCMVLVNGVVEKSRWIDWSYEKISCQQLRKSGSMTSFCEEYLLWHFFGRLSAEERSADLVDVVRRQLRRISHAKNLAMFMDAYSRRTAIRLSRPSSDAGGTSAAGITLKCGVLQICGSRSPALDDTIQLNTMLDPANSTWLKISNASGMLLDEKPNVATNAIVLFLQGYGYVVKMRAPSITAKPPQKEQELLAMSDIF